MSHCLWKSFFICALLCLCASAQNDGSPSRFCFIGVSDLADATAPHFDQYPVKGALPGGHANLDTHSNPVARTYRSVLRQQMSEGANFAGHYKVAVWGCGSSCAMFAVVNLNTGRVITPMTVYSVSGVHLGADDFLPESDSREWGFRYKKNSHLLVLVGTMNEDESMEGAFYYLLRTEKLVLVHKTLAERKTCLTNPDVPRSK
jgi:hypothetical protein